MCTLALIRKKSSRPRCHKMKQQHKTSGFFVYGGCLLFFVSLLLRGAAAASSTFPYKNACGGSTVLKANPGDSCNPGTAAAPCATGLVICHGTETLACIPRCGSGDSAADKPPPPPPPPVDDTAVVDRSVGTTITTTTSSPMQNQLQLTEPRELATLCADAQLRWCGGQNGYFSFEDRRCHCAPNFFGDSCEHYDPCYSVDCGDHGVCVQPNGMAAVSCRCDDGYGGPQCRTRMICQPGGVWRDDGCECNFAYTGRHCEICEKDIVCVPTKHSQQVFVAIRVAEPLREQLLSTTVAAAATSSSSLLGFKHSPILPGTSDSQGVYYSCDCKPLLPADSTEDIVDSAAAALRENYFFLLDDDSDIYYRRHVTHEKEQNSGLVYMSAFFDNRQSSALRSTYYLFGFFVIVAFLAGLVVSTVSCRSARYRANRQKKNDADILDPAISHHHHQQHQHREPSTLPLSMIVPIGQQQPHHSPTSTSHRFGMPQQKSVTSRRSTGSNSR